LAWQIEFEDSAKKSLAKIDKLEAKRIIRFLRERVSVAEDPRQLAKPLKGNWATLWRFRVGAYRVICDIDDAVLRVLVVRVAHRKNVY